MGKNLPQLHWIFLALTLLAAISPVHAQLAGTQTYAYLDMSPSARVSALGGLVIGIEDKDPNLGYQNPALYNPSMHGRISFSHSFFPGGINHGYLSYAHQPKKLPITWGGGILYRSYGSFDRRDDSGNWEGRFSASEYAIKGGVSFRSDKLTYGANVGLLYSQLESYNSIGMTTDFGAFWNDTASMSSAGLVLRNFGFQFDPYVSGNREALPFDLQLSFSKRLRYLPLRLTVTAHHLQQWDIRYDDPNAVQQTDILIGGTDEPEEPAYIADKIFRHLNFSGEFYFGPSFRVRVGYNHLRRQELAVASRQGLAGFSFGTGLRVRRFHLDYAYAVYNSAGANNHITLTTAFSEFQKK